MYDMYSTNVGYVGRICSFGCSKCPSSRPPFAICKSGNPPLHEMRYLGTCHFTNKRIIIDFPVGSHSSYIRWLSRLVRVHRCQFTVDLQCWNTDAGTLTLKAGRWTRVQPPPCTSQVAKLAGNQQEPVSILLYLTQNSNTVTPD